MASLEDPIFTPPPMQRWPLQHLQPPSVDPAVAGRRSELSLKLHSSTNHEQLRCVTRPRSEAQARTAPLVGDADAEGGHQAGAPSLRPRGPHTTASQFKRSHLVSLHSGPVRTRTSTRSILARTLCLPWSRWVARVFRPEIPVSRGSISILRPLSVYITSAAAVRARRQAASLW